MRTMLLILFFIVTTVVMAQEGLRTKPRVVEPIRVAITASKECPCAPRLSDILRDELGRSGRVVFRSRGAEWNIFLDVQPLEGLGCSGYSAAVYLQSGRVALLRTYAGLNLEAMAREIAAELEMEWSGK